MNKEKNKITIKNLEVFAKHGVLDFEKEEGQKFYVDADLYVDMVTPGMSDDLDDTVNYAQVCRDITDFMQNNRYDLIEAAAYNTAKMILLNYPKVQKIDITVHKPYAPIGLPFEDVSVSVSLMWHRVYLSIGSNMGDSEAYLNQAVESLYDDDMCRVISVSDYYVTKPYGPVEQDDFLNGCIGVDTLYSPHEMLKAVNAIEQEAGRTREIHWGPRTLDVDIVLYDNEMVCQPDLTVPHKEMHKREFVLVPLAQIAPYAVHPVFNKTVSLLLEELTEKELSKAGQHVSGSNCEKCAGCSGCAAAKLIR
ncbi:MAG: 2-amino-4-hydroxy-6-hydroxymethyldihydropteridine diphosphokinase, partial [Lachnospiraceae bacterium]|nr:2-amino-4-hydroxy-6-hydroxymethyldihydropteridine diphosphokinase [Lachnospiraceae bacterium]